MVNYEYIIMTQKLGVLASWVVGATWQCEYYCDLHLMGNKGAQEKESFSSWVFQKMERLSLVTYLVSIYWFMQAGFFDGYAVDVILWPRAGFLRFYLSTQLPTYKRKDSWVGYQLLVNGSDQCASAIGTH